MLLGLRGNGSGGGATSGQNKLRRLVRAVRLEEQDLRCGFAAAAGLYSGAGLLAAVVTSAVTPAVSSVFISRSPTTGVHVGGGGGVMIAPRRRGDLVPVRRRYMAVRRRRTSSSSPAVRVPGSSGRVVGWGGLIVVGRRMVRRRITSPGVMSVRPPSSAPRIGPRPARVRLARTAVLNDLLHLRQVEGRCISGIFWRWGLWMMRENYSNYCKHCITMNLTFSPHHHVGTLGLIHSAHDGDRLETGLRIGL